MTKERAALTSAAVTKGWTERLQVIRDFHPLGFAPTAHRGRRDGDFEGPGPPWQWWRWMATKNEFGQVRLSAVPARLKSKAAGCHADTLRDGLRGQAKTLPYGKHESSTKIRAVLRGSPNVTS
jgi:hypothetical protein